MRRLRSLLKELATLDVLDVGSGTGFYIDLWRRLGVRSVTGSDIAEKAVEELSARYPSNRFVRLDIGAEEDPLAERRATTSPPPSTSSSTSSTTIATAEPSGTLRTRSSQEGCSCLPTTSSMARPRVELDAVEQNGLGHRGGRPVGRLRGRREASVLRADERPDRFAQQGAAPLVAIAHARGRGERRVRLDCGSCALSHRDRALLDPSRGPEHGDDRAAGSRSAFQGPHGLPARHADAPHRTAEQLLVGVRRLERADLEALLLVPLGLSLKPCLRA